MSKKTIVLESIDPIEIYGAANKNLEALCTYFPNLKVVARGNEIILEGTEEDTLSFEKKLHMLIERRQHKMNVTPYDVEDLFDGESSPDSARRRRTAFAEPSAVSIALSVPIRRLFPPHKTAALIL